jgi:hypothetical protein
MVEYALHHTPGDFPAPLSIAYFLVNKSSGKRKIKEYLFPPMLFGKDREKEACSTPGNRVETIRDGRVTSRFPSQRERCESQFWAQEMHLVVEAAGKAATL